MSDNVDVANQLAEDAVERALANRVKTIPGVSPEECQECGDPIEQQRREVIPGTEHCSECAKWFAERKRFTNGGNNRG